MVFTTGDSSRDSSANSHSNGAGGWEDLFYNSNRSPPAAQIRGDSSPEIASNNDLFSSASFIQGLAPLSSWPAVDFLRETSSSCSSSCSSSSSPAVVTATGTAAAATATAIAPSHDDHQNGHSYKQEDEICPVAEPLTSFNRLSSHVHLQQQQQRRHVDLDLTALDVSANPSKQPASCVRAQSEEIPSGTGKGLPLTRETLKAHNRTYKILHDSRSRQNSQEAPVDNYTAAATANIAVKRPSSSIDFFSYTKAGVPIRTTVTPTGEEG